MSSIVQTIQKNTKSQKTLPISSSSSSAEHDKIHGLRRRLSSLSLNLHPSNISSTSAATWAIHRSKSLTSMGENAGNSIKNWGALGWAWVLSRKPNLFQDLEMNEEEKYFVGFHCKGSLKHLFFKVKSQFRRLFRYEDDFTLPQSFRYNNNGFSNVRSGNAR
ncbi:hypothetical protein RND81_14G228200 [Saponaria officinalis]|uniref:Uncharacterized protein n=1 Tax=Saponaria officinalis TaxID=3572 RepID=A0AAW1GR76_SAPOF